MSGFLPEEEARPGQAVGKRRRQFAAGWAAPGAPSPPSAGRGRDVLTVGLDAEPDQPLADRVLAAVRAAGRR